MFVPDRGTSPRRGQHPARSGGWVQAGFAQGFWVCPAQGRASWQEAGQRSLELRPRALLNTSAFKSIFVQSPVSSKTAAQRQRENSRVPRAAPLPDPGEDGLCPPDPGAGHRGPNPVLAAPLSFAKQQRAAQSRRQVHGEGARPLWWWGRRGPRLSKLLSAQDAPTLAGEGLLHRGGGE